MRRGRVLLPWGLLAGLLLWTAAIDGLTIKAPSLLKIPRNITAKNDTTTTTTTTTTEVQPDVHLEVDEDAPQEDGSNATKSKLTGNPQEDYVHDPNLPRELPPGYNLSSYPFFSRVPNDVEFECGEELLDGYYANVHYKCQVYHHCLSGIRYDFLCANYTAFDQKTFICHFVSEVDCANSAKFWNRNKGLYETPTTTTLKPPTTVPPPTSAPSRRQPQSGAQGRRRRPFRRRRPAYDYYYDEEYDEEEYEDDVTGPGQNAPRNRPRLSTPAEPPTDDKPFKADSSIYDRHRQPPKIRRPVPLNERNKYEYSSTTPKDDYEKDYEKPRSRNKQEDEYYDDEDYEQPIRSTSRKNNQDYYAPSGQDRDFNRRPANTGSGKPLRRNRPSARRKPADDDYYDDRRSSRPTGSDEEPRRRPGGRDESDRRRPSMEESRKRPSEENKRRPSAVDDEPRRRPVVDEDPRRRPVVDEEPRRRPVVDEEPRRRPAVDEEPRRRPIVDEEPRRRPVVDEDPRRRPVVDEEPRRRPVVDEEPRRRPVVDEEPRRRPVVDEEPRRRPASSEDHRRKPAALEDASKTSILDEPRRRPAAQEESRRRPIGLDEEPRRRPSPLEDSRRRPVVEEEARKTSEEEPRKRPSVEDDIRLRRPSVEEEIRSKRPSVEEEVRSRRPSVEEEVRSRRPSVEEEVRSRRPSVEEDVRSRRPSVEEEVRSRRPSVEEEVRSRRPSVEEEVRSRRPSVEEEVRYRRPSLEEEVRSRRPSVEEEVRSRRPAVEDNIRSKRPSVEEIDLVDVRSRRPAISSRKRQPERDTIYDQPTGSAEIGLDLEPIPADKPAYISTTGRGTIRNIPVDEVRVPPTGGGSFRVKSRTTTTTSTSTTTSPALLDDEEYYDDDEEEIFDELTSGEVVKGKGNVEVVELDRPKEERVQAKPVVEQPPVKRPPSSSYHFNADDVLVETAPTRPGFRPKSTTTPTPVSVEPVTEQPVEEVHQRPSYQSNFRRKANQASNIDSTKVLPSKDELKGLEDAEVKPTESPVSLETEKYELKPFPSLPSDNYVKHLSNFPKAVLPDITDPEYDVTLNEAVHPATRNPFTADGQRIKIKVPIYQYRELNVDSFKKGSLLSAASQTHIAKTKPPPKEEFEYDDEEYEDMAIPTGRGASKTSLPAEKPVNYQTQLPADKLAAYQTPLPSNKHVNYPSAAEAAASAGAGKGGNVKYEWTTFPTPPRYSVAPTRSHQYYKASPLNPIFSVSHYDYDLYRPRRKYITSAFDFYGKPY